MMCSGSGIHRILDQAFWVSCTYANFRLTKAIRLIRMSIGCAISIQTREVYCHSPCAALLLPIRPSPGAIKLKGVRQIAVSSWKWVTQFIPQIILRHATLHDEATFEGHGWSEGRSKHTDVIRDMKAASHHCSQGSSGQPWPESTPTGCGASHHHHTTWWY